MFPATSGHIRAPPMHGKMPKIAKNYKNHDFSKIHDSAGYGRKSDIWPEIGRLGSPKPPEIIFDMQGSLGLDFRKIEKIDFLTPKIAWGQNVCCHIAGRNRPAGNLSPAELNPC